MRILPWLSLVLTVLVGADGIYMVAAHYQPKDVNNFQLSDGGTVLVAAGLLLVITVAAFWLNSRSSRSRQVRANGVAPVKEVQ